MWKIPVFWLAREGGDGRFCMYFPNPVSTLNPSKEKME
jgi:hypothetical protein